MQRSKSQYTSQRTLATPAPCWRDSHWPRHIVLVVVHEETQRAVQEILNQLRKSGFATHETFRGANYVVAVGKKTSYVCGRVWNHVEDVPDVFCER
jgi:FAD/FMN-containing dehydrogenase